MKEKFNKEIIFSHDEFVMLSMALGGDFISESIDVNSLNDMPDDILEEKWNKIKSDFIKKGYIQKETEDGLVMDDNVYRIGTISANSSRYINYRQATAKKIISNEFMISDEGYIKVDLSREDEQLNTSLVESSENIKEIICNSIDEIKTEEIDKAEVLESANLTKKEYFKFTSAVNLKNIEKASDILMQNGMQEHMAQCAAKGFIERENFIMMSFKDMKKEYDEVLIYYVENNIWFAIKVSDDEEKIFSIKKISREVCKNSIKSYIDLKLS